MRVAGTQGAALARGLAWRARPGARCLARSAWRQAPGALGLAPGAWTTPRRKFRGGPSEAVPAKAEAETEAVPAQAEAETEAVPVKAEAEAEAVLARWKASPSCAGRARTAVLALARIRVAGAAS